MDLIVRGLIKMAVFCAALIVSGKFLLALFRRKDPQIDWFDPKVIFTAGMLSALIAAAASRIVKFFV